MSNLRDKIASHREDREEADVEVPEWGVTLRLVEPDGFRRAKLLNHFLPDAQTNGAPPDQARPNVDLTKMYPAVIIATATDPESGEFVFDDTEEDRALLNSRSGKVLERIAKAAMPLVGMDEEAVDRGKDGSSSDPTSATTTSSPSG